MLVQGPLAKLETETTGTTHLGKGVVCISEMEAVQRLLSLSNGYEDTKSLFHIYLGI